MFCRLLLVLMFFIYAVVYTIGFQKRGLPHAHILIWLKAGRENVCFNEIDKFVSVELLDRIIDHEGYKLVEQHMMHGPCELDKPNNSCMKNGICTKNVLDRFAFLHALMIKDTLFINVEIYCPAML